MTLRTVLAVFLAAVMAFVVAGRGSASSTNGHLRIANDDGGEAGIHWWIPEAPGYFYLEIYALGGRGHGPDPAQVDGPDAEYDLTTPIPNGNFVLRLAGGRLMGSARLWRVSTGRMRDHDERGVKESTATTTATFEPVELPSGGSRTYQLLPGDQDHLVSATFAVVPDPGATRISVTLSAWGREEHTDLSVPAPAARVYSWRVHLPESADVPFALAWITGAGTVRLSATGAVWKETGTQEIVLRHAPVSDEILFSLHGGRPFPTPLCAARGIPAGTPPVLERPEAHLVLRPDSRGTVEITENLTTITRRDVFGYEAECTAGTHIFPWDLPGQDPKYAGLLPVVSPVTAPPWGGHGTAGDGETAQKDGGNETGGGGTGPSVSGPGRVLSSPAAKAVAATAAAAGLLVPLFLFRRRKRRKERPVTR